MCNQWLHWPSPLVVQEVHFVQFLLSDQEAQYHLTSPVALEDQVNQEDRDLPEVKSQLDSDLMNHTN